MMPRLNHQMLHCSYSLPILFCWQQPPTRGPCPLFSEHCIHIAMMPSVHVLDNPKSLLLKHNLKEC